ncbi:hypothetical protein [Wolbachia endosymbiont of Nomada panzeri]|nr:hypothetical protein [Wolbachia endosymbiont of Nomada panzeri]
MNDSSPTSYRRGISAANKQRDDELLNYHNKGAGRVCQVSFFVSTE